MSRIALITGTTGGLGGEIASRLAAAGYGIATLNRSREKAEAQAEALRRAHPGQDVYPFVADLADTADVARVIDEIASACPRLDAIYNVSGVLTDRRVVGPQGLESHFAVNTLAPYLLIRGLRPSLAAAASAGGPAVVVNFSSEVVTGVKAFDVASLPDPPEIGGLFGAYAKTKLAVNAIGCMLADELRSDGILIYSVDPGATKTGMTQGNKGMPFFVRLIAPLVFKSVEFRAGQLLKAVDAAVEKGSTGLFISGGNEKPQPALAVDPPFQADLRKLLDRLAAGYSTSC